MRFYTFAKLYGNNVLLRGWDDKKGGHFKEKVPFSPTLFLPTNKQTEYKTLEGVPVAPIQPGTIKECREFVKSYQGIDGVQLYGMERYLYQFLSEEYPEDIEYDSSKIKMWSLDIETTAENGFPQPSLAEEEILLISLKNFNTKNIITFGSRPYNVTRDDVNYIECKNEYELLSTFLAWWQDVEPEAITGWNVELFDITYICTRMQKILGEREMRKLSPWGWVRSNEIDVRGRTETRYDIAGVAVLDYLDIYKKFTFVNRESYRLDAIAEIELGKKKLDHSEFETFRDFYTKGWNKFVDYNLVDVDLVDELEEKLKLIDLVMLMAYDAHVNYEDTFYQVRLWDVIIYNYLKKQNIVLNLLSHGKKNDQYAGAYVKEPDVGAYDWVVSFDLNSLYPSLIRFLNISPETLEDKKHPNADVEMMINKEADLSDNLGKCIAANGAMYRKDECGFMPELVRVIYDERVQYKKNMLECKQKYENNPSFELEKEIAKWSNFQMARKIQLNSLYGALGNAYFRHYRLDNAEAITLTGQVAIRWIERKVNEFLNQTLSTDGHDYVIASDTDSIYINLGNLVDGCGALSKDNPERIVDVLNQFCESKIVPFIDESYKELSDYLNCYEETLVMKRECIAEKGIWTAKKRYILNVWDNEGVRYNEPKLKMMGIEAVRSSTPAPCRKYIQEGLNIIMRGTEDQLIEYIEEKRKEWDEMTPEQIGFPRTANNISKFIDPTTLYRTRTPMHVRGSILFNHLLKQKKLSKKFNSIQDGEKIKYISLKEPNPIGENVISFINQFPNEFGLTDYIDYDIMFQKGFIDPMQTILDVIGWKTEKQATLFDFFT